MPMPGDETDDSSRTRPNKMLSVTCTAPVNIAVVKYWGKRDEDLILPVNSSLSATLDQSELCAKTTAAASREFTKDRMWLNGLEVAIDSKRYQNVLREIRRRARKRKKDEELDHFLQWHVHVCSENNFPTAAGLASSAAGLACLVFALAKLFKVEGDLSEIARQGSGSACRSIYGGFVEWNMGSRPNGSDSIAKQITTESHWPEMRVLILVVSSKKKPIGSSAGMQVSVETSDLLQYRVHQVVPERMRLMNNIILKKDFKTFADLTMKDSNQLHAICLDTYPPISYLTDTSRDIMRMVHAINSHHGENKVAYTFDAGPNACLYLLEKDVSMVMAVVKRLFPLSDNDQDNFIRGAPIKETELSKELLDAMPDPSIADAIQYAIHTRVGPGPQVLTDVNDSLLGNDGLPKTQKS